VPMSFKSFFRKWRGAEYIRLPGKVEYRGYTIAVTACPLGATAWVLDPNGAHVMATVGSLNHGRELLGRAKYIIDINIERAAV
jgi:hypothetical protein